MSQDLGLIDSYTFELPETLIAQAPVSPRDASRLMVIHKRTGRIEHRKFVDFPSYFSHQDHLVANNTKVIPARFLGRRVVDPKNHKVGQGGGSVEILLLENHTGFIWEAIMRSGARQNTGFKAEFQKPDGSLLYAELLSSAQDSPTRTVRVEFSEDPLLSGVGILPLPPYIERPKEGLDQDQFNYQTTFAQIQGSAAAPTAGLHFTPKILEELRSIGAGFSEITLHVGLGTFRPVKEQNLDAVKMHEERFMILPKVAEEINQAKVSNKKMTAVGTTTVRTLESACQDGRVLPGAQRTSIFIRPGYQFKAVDQLLTNFHLPKSTLLVLVCAFAGRDLILKSYAEAVREKYRFFSYGDAMLILDS